MSTYEASPPPYELARRMLDAIGWDGNNFRLRDPVANAISAEVDRINERALSRSELLARSKKL